MSTINIKLQCDEPFITRKEYAKRLDVSLATVSNMIDQGVLVSVKLKKWNKEKNRYETGQNTTVLIDLVATAMKSIKRQQNRTKCGWFSHSLSHGGKQ
ncbi:DNA-binding protein [Rodentibacter haemolyticus]|uniref:DNA-binding protein n=1 Tax=Rodentibacter haemolyticus TaxID=2778911 RepID=A0ABX6UYC1_9PAST|nr:DNA-binding protein [Rodentibacter haemolyticus]QPB43044.1 DNA-binding protein [Rodentibacter haemolyticus]